MREGEELSASTSLALGAAFASNKAYDILHAAQAKQAKYEEIGALGLDGVTISEDVVGAVQAETEQAGRDFETLSTMAGAVAMMEDSPFAIAQAEEPPAPKPKRPARQNGPPSAGSQSQGGERISKTAQAQDKLLITLLDSGGIIEAESTVSAGTVVRKRAEVSSSDWGNAKSRMASNKIIDVVASTTRVHFFDRITLNLETIEQMARDGMLRPDAEAAYKAFLESAPTSRGDRRFLDNEGGEEPVTEVEPRDEKLGLGTVPPPEEPVKDVPANPKPSRRRPTRALKGKNFTFDFNAEGSSFARRLSSNEIKGLPPNIRLLLGYGQVTSPGFAPFYETPERQHDYVLRIVNKGVQKESDRSDGIKVGELTEQALADGHLRRNGNGIELTLEGIEAIRETPFRNAKLGQKTGSTKQPEEAAQQPAGAGITYSEAALSRARRIA